MNNIEFLLRTYKDKITPGQKSLEELVTYLKNKVDVEAVETEAISNLHMRFTGHNVVHCLLNEQLKLSADDLDFVVYKLVRNEKSDDYYSKFWVNISASLRNELIYIIFETKTGYVYSNCNTLYLELYLKRGVSQFDYDNETLLLISYLSAVESYYKGEY